MKTDTPTEKPVGIQEIEFVTIAYPNFIVRHCFHENGNIVYQFYMEDPEVIKKVLMTGAAHKYTAFPAKFKDCLIATFEKKITIPEKLDIAYIELHHSFSVLARGYADSINRDSLLTPLLDELDKALSAV